MVGGTTVTTPYVATVIAGSAVTVSAVSPQTVGGTLYQFASWSDGGAQSHTVATGTSQTYTVTLAAVDVTPPVRSNGLPTGTLAVGTTQATLSLTTNENATCRYATTAGVAYASMTSTFTTTGGTTHSTTVTGLTNGGSYNFFVRCQDAAGQRQHQRLHDHLLGGAGSGYRARRRLRLQRRAPARPLPTPPAMATPALLSGATWSTQGRFGNALSFNGTNDWVTVASTAAA